MSDKPDHISQLHAEIERLTAESHRNRIEFLKTELASCSTFASVAETEFRSGEHEAAERALGHAEDGYATVVRLMSDPKYADHMTDEERRELRARIERLRSTLDDLRRAE
jgi:hypothetical protein